MCSAMLCRSQTHRMGRHGLRVLRVQLWICLHARSETTYPKRCRSPLLPNNRHCWKRTLSATTLLYSVTSLFSCSSNALPTSRCNTRAFLVERRTITRRGVLYHLGGRAALPVRRGHQLEPVATRCGHTRMSSQSAARLGCRSTWHRYSTGLELDEAYAQERSASAFHVGVTERVSSGPERTSLRNHGRRDVASSRTLRSGTKPFGGQGPRPDPGAISSRSRTVKCVLTDFREFVWSYSRSSARPSDDAASGSLPQTSFATSANPWLSWARGSC